MEAAEVGSSVRREPASRPERAAAPRHRPGIAGPGEARSFDKRQSPKQPGSSHSPCPGNKRKAGLCTPGSAAAPARRRGWGQRTRPGQGSGEDARRGLRSHVWSFVPSRRRRPGLGCPCPHLVDVAVGAAADALDQLEVLLRVPAGQVEAGVHGGPRVPPASLPARGGGALRGAARRERPRPARLCRRSQSPGCTPRPPQTTTSRRRPRPPPPRGAGSHPPGEERARSPSLGVQLQHGFRPPLRPPSRSRPASHCAAAIPDAARSRRALRAPGMRARREAQDAPDSLEQS